MNSLEKKNKNGSITLIYIGGYGHSGSTILEILLCCNPKIKGLGELFRFEEALYSRYTKKLLKENSECSSMYSRIEQALEETGESLKSYEEVRNCETIGFNQKKMLTRYNRLWITFFKAIQDGDTSIKIVDSSKTPFAHLKRFHLLESLPQVDAYMIHLLRHPRPILIRLLKNKKEKTPKMSTHSKLFYLFKCSFSWLFANLWPLITTNRNKYVRICFEELCEKPDVTLKKVENKIGLDVNETIRTIKNKEVLPFTCAITGNMRVRKSQDLKFQSSKKSIPKTDLMTVLVSWLVVPFYYLLR